MTFRETDDKKLLKEFADWLNERWLNSYSDAELAATVEEFYKTKEIR